MNAEFTISVGLNDKETHVQQIETDAAKQLVFDMFGDCTLQICLGRFTHENGAIVQENSFRVFVYDDHTKKPVLADKCRKLKQLLNQESIVLSWRPCGETDFI